MREVKASAITAALCSAIKSALVRVESETNLLLRGALEKESSPVCRWALECIIENNETAASTLSHPCQDCGQAVVFVDLGQDVRVTEGLLTDAINEAVEAAYADARKSVADPLTRQNTGTNTPAVIHYDIVPGDKITVSFLAKGAGSENMSAVYMLTPSKGEEGIIDCVTKHVADAGANPCPPVIIGVGIGGTMEKSALLSKRALIRPTGTPNPDAKAAALEQKILNAVNKTGVGAQGFGGDITALAVSLETAPTHIGMLPIAVNLQCHSVRHAKIVL